MVKDTLYYSKRFVNEFLEALIVLSVFYLLKSDKGLTSYKFFSSTLVVAIITFVLEEYAADSGRDLKKGLLLIMSSKLL